MNPSFFCGFFCGALLVAAVAIMTAWCIGCAITVNESKQNVRQDEY